MARWRPGPEDLARAANRRVPDVIAPGLGVLFVGINPGLWSAATGHHFARPGNRFWPALHGAGFTPRLLAPDEERLLLDLGCGVTNIVPRASASAAELARDELRRGGCALARKVRRTSPRWVAVLGVTAYRSAFERPRAGLGPQEERLGGAGVWVLPNPSGLNAHHQLPDLVRLFAELRAALAR
ncbi:MAG: G/U mismatch-specific DNA glycosylase [Acidobacteria bacterium]|nr:G/U mismatch-specific DNA glycosylase [Acidobacteriota bacterium]